MKTTVEISEPVLREAKETGHREGTTLRNLVEEGLRLALQRREETGKFRLRDASVGGKGLQPGVEGATWQEMLDLAYRGRGS